ncbi:GTPase-associated protein 1-related protein [Actinosynnema sp. NPDC020468]|uniref:GTPase-associated protein 1-related protein n=1 Tax=Actinosynnema sp. NPDC020468 TaxID=3154488 RepID=UPI0033F7796D
MMVRQLHYTSCENGLEGIQGFQVSAMTPGIPRPLVDLAVRASAYEPGPGLVDRLDDDDLGGFPVAFGFAPSGRAGALFASRYAGADFTGRMGNYFAHALVFEDVGRELGDVLPIDLWGSRVWARAGAGGTALPELTSVAPGGETDLPSTRRLLGRPGAIAVLDRVLGTTHRLLLAGRGRLVLVVPDDRTGARWLAATCRSLPHPLGLDVSFTTYTSRPEESSALVSCTTPDVRLPTYGDFTVIDLTADRPTAEGTRYSSALGGLWDRDAVPEALALAARADPPLAAADLDTFAVLAEKVFDLPVTAPAGDALLLAAVRLAVDRIRERLPDHAWDRIADEVQDTGGPTDAVGWAAVLRAASGQGQPVPSKLLGAYYVAALGVRERLWLPVLAPIDLEDVAENVVLPALVDATTPTLPERLAERPDLLDALVQALDRRLFDQREAARLAAALTAAAARVLAGRGDGRIRLLTDVALARHGEVDKVRVMADGTRRHEVDWPRFGPVLWPEDPSTDESLRLLRDVPVQVLEDSGVGARIVARALDHASRDESGRAEGGLVEALLRSPFAARLRPADRAGLKAVESIAYFRGATPGPRSERVVLANLAAAASVRTEVGDRLLAAVASFVLRADAKVHRDLLDRALADHGSVFLPAYREAALVSLAAASPHHVAGVVVAWRGVAGTATRTELVDGTLAAALRKRRGRHLDRIGESLQPMADVLGVSAPRPNWAKWWQDWRVRHERRGLLSLFRRGKA